MPDSINRAAGFIQEFNQHLNTADKHIKELVSWIAPNGDYYLETRENIMEMISTGSWR